MQLIKDRRHIGRLWCTERVKKFQNSKRCHLPNGKLIFCNRELISISVSCIFPDISQANLWSYLLVFCLAGSNFKGLTVNLSQTSEIKGETLTVSPLQKTFTESVLIGENVSTNIQSWWGDQFSQQQQEHENWPRLSGQWVSIVSNTWYQTVSERTLHCLAPPSPTSNKLVLGHKSEFSPLIYVLFFE